MWKHREEKSGKQVKKTDFEQKAIHGSHRSWHTFFKDFSRTFEVHFQGVFKDFSLFFQTSIREKMINNGLVKKDKQRPYDLEFARNMGGGGGFGYVFLTFLDDLLYI